MLQIDTEKHKQICQPSNLQQSLKPCYLRKYLLEIISFPLVVTAVNSELEFSLYFSLHVLRILITLHTNYKDI